MTKTGRHSARNMASFSFFGLMTVLLLAGCSLDGLLKSDELPPSVSDPEMTKTPQGAVAAYRGTQATFRVAFGGSDGSFSAISFVPVTGEISDELNSRRFGLNPAVSVLTRFLPETSDDAKIVSVYSRLQKVRGQATQAIGLLTRYVREDSALVGHVYALKGYAEVFLAELFCSGIPLSTLDFDGDFTYRAGSTTEAVLTHAVALFDSALALAGDSARFVALAQMGKARALLGLGDYEAAAAVVAGVADNYRYTVTYNAVGTANSTDEPRNFADAVGGDWFSSVSDHEGSNGLDYRTAGDPRVTVTILGTVPRQFWHPNKYLTNGSSSIVLASGVEARLIEAEAALGSGSAEWLTKLNALRTDGTFDTQPTADPADDPAAMDTLWHAGSGGFAGLELLEDPGASLADPAAADSARVDLVFRERAFWLFLTGQRQGDLRRLVRQYGRDQEQVYPVGPYAHPTPQGQIPFYGSDVNAPIPTSERLLNPLFTGCISRGA